MNKNTHKTCKGCGDRYEKGQQDPAFRNWCSFECAMDLVERRKDKEFKAETRRRKESIKGRSDYAKDAQVAFNKFIRLRDQHLPCVSCNRHHEGQYHAGHYRTTAAQPALRFSELNCHKQCQPCNTHKSGNITEYRIELVRRIGSNLVEWLEIDHKQPSKWTIDELKAIKKYYTDAVKAMRGKSDEV